MKILAIIPARGSSKAVPKKNITLLAGKPLIYYTIREAKKSHSISRIIISTDCSETIEIAKLYGVEVPFIRPEELSGDNVQDFPVCEHAIKSLKEKEGYVPDVIVWLRPTSPFRKVKHIDEAVEILMSNTEGDSVRSLCFAPKHPLKMWEIKSKRLVPFVPTEVTGIKEQYNYPRQKLPPAYVQNGAIDVIQRRTITEKKSISGDIILPYIMEDIYSINIDSQLDFEIAEILMKKRLDCQSQ
jgi:CMP-N-acetylneuraminic acid synthetase|tara:strand:- start:1053 stop:1778 length:726 start_codon:yes stop_codon:yes gene_type:complete